MNRALIALVAVAGVAAAASAQDFYKVDVQVNDGSGWADTASVTAAGSVQVRFLISWSRAAGAFSWGGMTLSQLNVTDSAATDTASNFGGRPNPQSQTFSLFGAGTASAKIDRLDNVNGSIQTAQLPVNNGGVTDNPIVAFTFDYNITDLSLRTVVLDAPSTNITLAQIFTNASGSSTSMAAGTRQFDGARINVVPAPGAMALAGLAGLAGLRRRRA